MNLAIRIEQLLLTAPKVYTSAQEIADHLDEDADRIKTFLYRNTPDYIATLQSASGGYAHVSRVTDEFIKLGNSTIGKAFSYLRDNEGEWKTSTEIATATGGHSPSYRAVLSNPRTKRRVPQGWKHESHNVLGHRLVRTK